MNGVKYKIGKEEKQNKNDSSIAIYSIICNM